MKKKQSNHKPTYLSKLQSNSKAMDIIATNGEANKNFRQFDLHWLSRNMVKIYLKGIKNAGGERTRKTIQDLFRRHENSLKNGNNMKRS